MKRIILLTIFFTVLTMLSYSQFSIRKAFESKTADDDKPATFSFTIPAGKSNSYLINAGIGYDFLKIKKNTFGGFFVYNKNNEIGKEQHNYKLGITGKTIIGGDPLFSVIGGHAIQYKRDYVDTNHSVIVTTYWHLFSKKEHWIKFGGYSNPTKTFSYFFQPQVGLEYQNLIDAKKKLIPNEGSDFRGLLSIGGNMLLRSKLDTSLKAPRRTKFIEFVISYDYRFSMSSNIKDNPKDTHLFKCGLNIYPAKNNNFSIGCSYNNGENPVDGTKNQEFWMFALQFKIN